MGFIGQIFSRRRREPDIEQQLEGLGERELISLAHRKIGADQLEQALQVLDRAHQRFPQSSDIGQLHDRLRNEVGHRMLDQLLDQADEAPSVQIFGRIATLYRQLDDPENALMFGTLAIQEGPESAIGYKAVGTVHLDLFRLSGDTIAGMNALRYVVKGHSLATRDSRILLQLSEIFTILQAPEAARRFLQPVSQAFPDHELVQALNKRLQGLPSEGTSQIQELFLRYERVVMGAPAQPVQAIELAPECLDEIVSCARQRKGTTGFYLVDAGRNLLCGFHENGMAPDELGNTFGLIAETALQNCQRMDLGAFDWLTVEQDESFLAVARIEQGLTAIYFGSASVQQQDAQDLVREVRQVISSVTLGAK